MKTCGHVCKTDADVDELISRKQKAGDSTVREARYVRSDILNRLITDW